jgi:putative membrane protein
MRFIVKLIINAIALWLTTLIVAGISVHPWEQTTFATIVTYLLVALIFGIVNGVVGTVVRIVAWPLYILTLGILALVVNALLFMLAGWVSGWFGFGLVVDGFWSGFWGAIVLAIISWLMGLLLRPLVRR